LPVSRILDQIDPSVEGTESSRPVAGLVLLGTVHCDPKGLSRTRTFLEFHRPDLILVEISDFALKLRTERSAELRKIFRKRLRVVSDKMHIDFHTALKHVEIASILRQIGFPYEYRASAVYARRTGIALVAVDYSEFSRQWIETWPEMISVENIERLLKLESSRPSVSSLYAQAARRIDAGPLPIEAPPADAVRWSEREKQMALRIRSALERLNPERPVYIGGWWHLSRGGSIETIRELLGIGADSCRLLDRGVINQDRDSVRR